MRYTSFKIENYKGVRNTTIDIPVGSLNAVTLIGLNESGKTTLLEAIYSFSPDPESEPLFIDNALLPDETSRIPRDKLFSFSDEMAVIATVEFSPGEKDIASASLRDFVIGSALAMHCAVRASVVSAAASSRLVPAALHKISGIPIATKASPKPLGACVPAIAAGLSAQP